MEIRVIPHAKKRMNQYNVDIEMIQSTLKDPDSLLNGYAGRKIAQKALNQHLLRVIFEEKEDINVIVTVYKARRERYEV